MSTVLKLDIKNEGAAVAFDARLDFKYDDSIAFTIGGSQRSTSNALCAIELRQAYSKHAYPGRKTDILPLASRRRQMIAGGYLGNADAPSEQVVPSHP